METIETSDLDTVMLYTVLNLCAENTARIFEGENEPLI